MGFFWRLRSKLCAAVIALELRFCRLAEQAEHNPSERFLPQGYLLDIGRAADRAVGCVVFVFDGDGRGVRRSDRSCVRRRVCGVSDIFPVGFGDVVRIGHKNALDSVGEVFLDGFDAFLDGLSTLFEAEKVLVHGDFVGGWQRESSVTQVECSIYFCLLFSVAVNYRAIKTEIGAFPERIVINVYGRFSKWLNVSEGFDRFNRIP